jgi:hypothetical protein
MLVSLLFKKRIYTTQRESICPVSGKKDYPSEAKHDKENSNNCKWII